MEEGIQQVEDVYEEIRKIQLGNIVRTKKKEVVLFTNDNFKDGNGLELKPEKVLLAFIELDDCTKKGIIINDYTIVSIGDLFLVAYDDDDLVIVADEIIETKNFPYEEIDTKENIKC